MNWKLGRQGNGYQTLTILSSDRFKFDIHLLKMPTNSKIVKHIDPISQLDQVTGYNEHHRLNIVLKKATVGGIFQSDELNYVDARVIKFRPDIDPHSVTEVWYGTRYVLSIGWLKKCKQV